MNLAKVSVPNDTLTSSQYKITSEKEVEKRREKLFDG